MALIIAVAFPQPPFWRRFLWPWYVFVSLWVSLVCISSLGMLPDPKPACGRRASEGLTRVCMGSDLTAMSGGLASLHPKGKSLWWRVGLLPHLRDSGASKLTFFLMMAYV